MGDKKEKVKKRIGHGQRQERGTKRRKRLDHSNISRMKITRYMSEKK